MRNKKLVFENSHEVTNINISALKIINAKKISFLYSTHANNVQAILSLIKKWISYFACFPKNECHGFSSVNT